MSKADERDANKILHDYNNHEWAGLVADYYLPRWRLYFDSLQKSLTSTSGKPPESIDWYELGDRFNRATKTYSSKPEGDTYAAASAVAHAVEVSGKRPGG